MNLNLTSPQVIATYISTILIDRTGRRILLLISATVMSICLVALGVYFHLKTVYDTSAFSSIPLISLALFIVLFSIGFGPIPWMMMGEIFPTKVKGLASSVSASFNWLLAFTVTKLFQNMLDTIGTSVTFVLFGVVCALAIAFVFFVIPETKGKDIHEINNILLGKTDTKKELVEDVEDNAVTLVLKN